MCLLLTDEAPSMNVATVTEDNRKCRKRKRRKEGDGAPPSECSHTSTSPVQAPGEFLRTTALLTELFDGLCQFLLGSLSLYMQVMMHASSSLLPHLVCVATLLGDLSLIRTLT